MSTKKTVNRRTLLKQMGAGSAAAAVIISGCNAPADVVEEVKKQVKYEGQFGPQEILDRNAKINAETFFTDHEMETVKVLIDIIIPEDEKSGSATSAGVHDFIEFTVKDRPNYKVPVRGGLAWLDAQGLKRFNKQFVDCESAQRIEIIEDIAWPEKAKPEHSHGVKFFNTMRDLTASGFFSSSVGYKDLDFMGNTMMGKFEVPADVMAEMKGIIAKKG